LVDALVELVHDIAVASEQIGTTYRGPAHRVRSCMARHRSDGWSPGGASHRGAWPGRSRQLFRPARACSRAHPGGLHGRRAGHFPARPLRGEHWFNRSCGRYGGGPGTPARFDGSCGRSGADSRP